MAYELFVYGKTYFIDSFYSLNYNFRVQKVAK